MQPTKTVWTLSSSRLAQTVRFSLTATNSLLTQTSRQKSPAPWLPKLHCLPLSLPKQPPAQQQYRPRLAPAKLPTQFSRQISQPKHPPALPQLQAKPLPAQPLLHRKLQLVLPLTRLSKQTLTQKPLLVQQQFPAKLRLARLQTLLLTLVWTSLKAQAKAQSLRLKQTLKHMPTKRFPTLSMALLACLILLTSWLRLSATTLTLLLRLQTLLLQFNPILTLKLLLAPLLSVQKQAHVHLQYLQFRLNWTQKNPAQWQPKQHSPLQSPAKPQPALPLFPLKQAHAKLQTLPFKQKSTLKSQLVQVLSLVYKAR